MENEQSFVNPGLRMTVSEESVQNRKRKKTLLLRSSHFVFIGKIIITKCPP